MRRGVLAVFLYLPMALPLVVIVVMALPGNYARWTCESDPCRFESEGPQHITCEAA